MAKKLNDFVQEVLDSPCFGFIAAVDESNQPVMTRGFGFKYDEKQTTFTMYTFQKDCQRLIIQMSEVAKVAATITNALDFKTVQFKGTYKNHYLTPDEEMIYAQKCNSKQAEIMQMLGISKELFAHWHYSPSIAIVMDVEEMFDQTPKNNTGNKIN